MTWYAHEIITRGTPEAVRAVREDPLLKPLAYCLQGPFEYSWYRPEQAHGFPNPGLLVIRPVCDPCHCAEWYNEPFLDWELHPAVMSSPLDPRVVAEDCSVEAAYFPPVRLLGYLQYLAVHTGGPFVFYGCSTWGGSIDSEYAFVLGRAPSAIVALPDDCDENGRPRVAIVEEHQKKVVSHDVLRLALAALDFHLPTSVFAPHMREFCWQNYQLGSDDG